MALNLAFRCAMIYIIVMWAFMMGDTLTGYSIPWLTKTAHVLAYIGIVVLFIYAIVTFGVITYAVIANDPSIVEAIK